MKGANRCPPNTQESDWFNCSSVNYKRKTWVLASACSTSRPTTAKLENKQRNIHAGVYSTPVKCASEDMVSPRSTLRSCIYYTPWQSPLHCSCPVFDCGSFEVQKQSVSNAFQYVVLCPTAPSTSDDITALRVDSICKDTKKFYYPFKIRCNLNQF